MLLIGLTGGIASGKTFVSNRFATLGAPVIDADILARQAVEPGSAGLKALVNEFGQSILQPDQSLDRGKLRELIFSNTAHKDTVNNFLHPIIRQLSDEAIAREAQTGTAYVIYAVPLLVETGQTERFDRIAVVDVPVGTQIARLMQRDNTTADKAQAILDAQATREQRLAIADDVIDNNGSKEHTIVQVDKLHELYSLLAQ